ncbi:hypothetical protein ACFL0O_02175 [Thermodesulfobacteriota bacterium]
MPEEALKIYNTLLEDIPEEEPEKMGHIRHMIGRCYDKLVLGSNTEENLARAIQSYETVLEIRTLEKYPVLHKVIISNMVSTLNALDN